MQTPPSQVPVAPFGYTPIPYQPDAQAPQQFQFFNHEYFKLSSLYIELQNQKMMLMHWEADLKRREDQLNRSGRFRGGGRGYRGGRPRGGGGGGGSYRGGGSSYRGGFHGGPTSTDTADATGSLTHQLEEFPPLSS